MAEKIVVASGKGGVGKSTCAAGIAVALNGEGKKVLLTDFDVGLKSLDVIFGVSEKNVNNWGDIILDRCSFEQAVIDCGGVKLLTAPPKSDDSFNEKNLSRLIGEIEGDFDYIIIDSPAGIGRYFNLAVSIADRGIVVANPEDVCVRSAYAAAEKMREAGIDDTRLIINKFIKKFSLKKKNLNIDSVIDETAVKLIGIVTYDEDIALVSMENKEFNLSKKPQKAFSRIAKRICGENIELKI